MEENRNTIIEKPNYADDEIDLASIFRILWRRKILMLAVFIFVVTLAVVYIATATPRYRIAAQIAAGISGYDQQGNPEQVLSKADIQNWYSEKSYMGVPAESASKIDRFPKLSISTSRDSNLLTLEFNHLDPNQGVSIMASLTDLGIKNFKPLIEGRIEVYQSKMASVRSEILSIDNNIRQTTALIERLRIQTDSINQNTQQLMNLRERMAEGNSDKFALLMYSNIIQQNIQYVTDLEERIAVLEEQLNKLSVSKSKKNEELKEIENKIDSLIPIVIVQRPFSTQEPVEPAKLKIVALSVVIGGMLAIFTAFIGDFLIRSKREILSSNQIKGSCKKT